MNDYATKPGPLLEWVIKHDNSGHAKKIMGQLGREFPEQTDIIDQTITADGMTVDFYLRYLQRNENDEQEVRIIAYQTIDEEIIEIQERIVGEKNDYRKTADINLMRQMPETMLELCRGTTFGTVTTDGILALYRNWKVIDTYSRFLASVGHQTRFTVSG